MEPWVETMVAGLRQQVKELKEQNEQLKRVVLELQRQLQARVSGTTAK